MLLKIWSYLLTQGQGFSGLTLADMQFILNTQIVQEIC